MNKAFCKEPDTSLPPRCPRCGVNGVQVADETLRAHLLDPASEPLGEPAYFCGSDACEVAYFDLLERCVDASAVRGLCWPKDPAGPLCSCHGLTVDDIDADIDEGTPSRVRRVVQAAARPDAACAVKSPDGRSCAGRVQRHYMRRRAELGG